MKRLLIATAAMEVGAGVALVCFPLATALLLLGAPLTTPAALTVGRIAAVALLALGVACWLVCGDAGSESSRGLVTAMCVYNLGAALVLGASGVVSQSIGVALWPAVAIHVAMGVWCIRTALR